MEGYTILAFGAEWCSYSKTIGEQIKEVKPNVPHVQFIYYNIRYDYKAFKDWNIENVPSVILLENGKEIYRYDGCSRIDFSRMLSLTLPSPSPW
jgi:thiol-disulfide isomerase/thioredoxin